MSIKFNKKENRYIVTFKNDNKYVKITYSKNSYGKYAKLLAELTEETKLRYNNYIEEREDYCIMIIYSKKYGYHEVYFDIDDLTRVKERRWTLKKDRNIFYVQSFVSDNRTSITLHKFILQYDGNGLIDHIDRNGLNNRRSNFRIVSDSINCRNRIDNNTNSIFPGVYEKGNHFIVSWFENVNERKTKSFSIKKYGRSKALMKAKRKSIIERLKNNYLVDEKYIEQIRILVKIMKCIEKI